MCTNTKIFDDDDDDDDDDALKIAPYRNSLTCLLTTSESSLSIINFFVQQLLCLRH